MRVRILLIGLSASLLLACAADHKAPVARAVNPPAMQARPDAGVTSSIADAGVLPPLPQTANASDPPPDDPKTEDPNPTPGVVPPGVDADDVREAVFRHMFGSNASGQGKQAGVYCLEVEGQADPTAGFLSRMKDVKPAVKAVSHCSASAEHGVVDKATHAHGLIFRIETITFKDARHATATGGYYEAGLSASGNIYTLERRGSTWVVTKDQMTWIS